MTTKATGALNFNLGYIGNVKCVLFKEGDGSVSLMCSGQGSLTGKPCFFDFRVDLPAPYSEFSLSLKEKLEGQEFALLTFGLDGKAKLIGKDGKECYSLSDFRPFVGIDDASSGVWQNARAAAFGLSGSSYRVVVYDEAFKERWTAYHPLKRKPISKEDREAVYALTDGHCAYCGKPIAVKDMQVDHVEAHYRHHGKDEIANYLPACRDCNGLKSDYSLEEFRNVLIPECASHLKEGKRTRKGRIAAAYGLSPMKKNEVVFYFEKGKEKNER